MKHVALTEHDIDTLHQALNEVCHGIDVPEFSTRMGATKEECLALMDKLKSAMTHLPDAWKT